MCAYCLPGRICSYIQSEHIHLGICSWCTISTDRSATGSNVFNVVLHGRNGTTHLADGTIAHYHTFDGLHSERKGLTRVVQNLSWMRPRSIMSKQLKNLFAQGFPGGHTMVRYRTLPAWQPRCMRGCDMRSLWGELGGKKDNKTHRCHSGERNSQRGRLT